MVLQLIDPFLIVVINRKDVIIDVQTQHQVSPHWLCHGSQHFPHFAMWYICKWSCKAEFQHMYLNSKYRRRSFPCYLHATSPQQGSHNLDPFRYTLKLTNRSDRNVMDPWILRDMECLNPWPSCSHQKLSLSIQKDLKMIKLWHRKPKIIFFRWATFKTSDPLNFLWTSYIWVLQSLQDLEKNQLDPLNFWVRATPGPQERLCTFRGTLYMGHFAALNTFVRW